MRILIIITLLAASCSSLLAQKKFLQNLEVGGGPGIYIYEGDLSPQRLGSFKTPRFGLNVWASKPVKKDLALRIGLSIASLRGDESKYDNPDYRQQRNLAFTTPLAELSAHAVYSPTSYGRISPYAFAGAGLSYMRINRDASRFNASYFGEDGSTIANLAADMARPAPRLLPVIPVGAGVRYMFNERFSAYAENSFRITRTDYLDGFSKVANPDRKDNFHSTQVGLIYAFGKKSKAGCPAVN